MDVDGQGAIDDSYTLPLASGIIPLPFSNRLQNHHHHHPHHHFNTQNTVMNNYKMDTDWLIPTKVDDTNETPSNKKIYESCISIIDKLDTRVEALRKEALNLQDQRDHLLMTMDLIKNSDMLAECEEHEREEISCYIKRVGARLSTVELSVKTVRDKAQEDSLNQINGLIDSVISNGDSMAARQKCQTYLNACSSSDATLYETDAEKIRTDKKFESTLLGCTLDDQKIIKKRLLALMEYLNKQIVSN